MGGSPKGSGGRCQSRFGVVCYKYQIDRSNDGVKVRERNEISRLDSASKGQDGVSPAVTERSKGEQDGELTVDHEVRFDV